MYLCKELFPLKPWARICFCFLNERETGNRNAVKLRQDNVQEIDPYSSIPYQVRSELPIKSQKSKFSVVRYVYGNFCYWYHVVQYYLSHLDRGSPIWMLSCFQNKTEEAKVEVRPCIIYKPTALRID